MESKREQYEARRTTLTSKRATYAPDWQAIATYIAPTRYRTSASDVDNGARKNASIIDSTGTFAARTLASGMMSGITSPSRPWMMLASSDPDMMEYEPVRVWLDGETRGLLDMFNRSNIYNMLHRIYGDIGCFGTAAAGVLEDDHDIIRGYDFPTGTYVLGANDRLEVDTWMRDPFQMTVRNIVRRFGMASCSPDVQDRFRKGRYEDPILVVHCITPNPDHDERKIDSKFKRWLSCYYEVAGDKTKTLSDSGFDTFPILAPRWETTGEDVLGRGPGHDAIGDVKALQKYERTTAMAVEKMVNPPLVGQSTLRTAKVSQLPGDITYADLANGQPALRALHEVSFRVGEAEAKMAQIRERINRAFYADLFLMMANDERAQPITAREIAERHEEKLLALGPVLERLNGELLRPLIDRAFAIRLKRGMVRPPPPELQGQELRVEYISIMAQAQKMVGLAGLERTVGFAMQMATIDPTVMDKIDTDQVLDNYGENVGLPPKIIRPDDQVAQIRQQRAQARQQAAQAQQGALMAKSAKDLSQAPTEGDNALAKLIETTTGAAP